LKILLISDTHGSSHLLKNNILPKYASKVQLAVHLGDFAKDLLDLSSRYPYLPMVGVDGAFEADTRVERILMVGDEVKLRLLLMHGHTLGVKSSFDRIVYYAREKEVDACFFGHTHIPTCFTKDGIFFMNPGSLTEPRGITKGSYGIVEISAEGEITGEVIKV